MRKTVLIINVILFSLFIREADCFFPPKFQRNFIYSIPRVSGYSAASVRTCNRSRARGHVETSPVAGPRTSSDPGKEKRDLVVDSRCDKNTEPELLMNEVAGK